MNYPHVGLNYDTTKRKSLVSDLLPHITLLLHHASCQTSPGPLFLFENASTASPFTSLPPIFQYDFPTSLPCSMFHRVNQLSRHLARQSPSYTRPSAAKSVSAAGINMMTSSMEQRSKRMIHTAGCIIIGDEVLGGKV